MSLDLRHVEIKWRLQSILINFYKNEGNEQNVEKKGKSKIKSKANKKKKASFYTAKIGSISDLIPVGLFRFGCNDKKKHYREWKICIQINANTHIQRLTTARKKEFVIEREITTQRK